MRIKKKNKRVWNFKRSKNQDRSFLDWCGARKEPSVLEGMATVDDFLGDIVDEIGLREGVTLDDLTAAWADIVGGNIANNSEPLEIRAGVLRIRVSQPVIKFELQQRKTLLIKRVQEQLPEAKIKRIDVVV